MSPRRGRAGPASPALPHETSHHGDGDDPNPNGWLRHREVYAAVPVSVAQMKCALCIHAFALLDLPDNRDGGLSINKLASLMGADWHPVDWHVRHHLGAAGWVTITESTGRGSPSKVRIAHNPSACRGLVSGHARPLTTVERLKPPARKAPKFGTPHEQVRDPARTQFGTPHELARDPARALSVDPSVCDLFPPVGPPPPTWNGNGKQAGKESNLDHRDGAQFAAHPQHETYPSTDEPTGEERATARERPHDDPWEAPF